MDQFRIETDSMGEIEVPVSSLWGAQTQRSLENFNISSRSLEGPFIQAMIEIKRACAQINSELEQLPENIGEAIIQASEELLNGEFPDQFPLDVYQTGSGTQSNMNVNEVIANRASQILGGEVGSKLVHPNDHVNKGQSSNDIVPSAMHISALYEITYKLIPAIDHLRNSLLAKQEEYMKIVKIGRTHLQDAVPLTLGQEFSGYVSQLDLAKKHLEDSMKNLEFLAVGGTAVGTGLNAHKDLGTKVCDVLSKRLNLNLRADGNKFMLIAGKDGMLATSGALRVLAVSLMKISNDIRWLASGPRGGLGELILPANEPGSSIMPGKINPTQNEMMIQVAAQVLGNDTAISVGAQWGVLELNLMKPMIISNLLESIEILSNGMISFADRSVAGLIANTKRIDEIVENSLMVVTALTKIPEIGYDKAAKIAKKAHEEGKTIREILLENKILTWETCESANLEGIYCLCDIFQLWDESQNGRTNLYCGFNGNKMIIFKHKKMEEVPDLNTN